MTYLAKATIAKSVVPPGMSKDWKEWKAIGRRPAIIGERLTKAQTCLSKLERGGAKSDQEADAVGSAALALATALERENIALIQSLRGLAVTGIQKIVRDKAAELAETANFLKDLRKEAEDIEGKSKEIVKSLDQIAVLARGLDGLRDKLALADRNLDDLAKTSEGEKGDKARRVIQEAKELIASIAGEAVLDSGWDRTKPPPDRSLGDDKFKEAAFRYLAARAKDKKGELDAIESYKSEVKGRKDDPEQKLLAALKSLRDHLKQRRDAGNESVRPVIRLVERRIAELEKAK
jgi:hypothetical protein